MKVMSGSNGIRIILWMFLLIIKGGIVRGQATGGPNAVALIKGQATLDCVTVLLAASSWTHTTNGSSNALLIAVGCAAVTGNDAAFYRTELLGVNICRLIIANVTMQQAGVYRCSDGGTATYRSLVTVIDPVANVVVHNQSAEVVDGDQLNISCSINYNGPASPAPSLRPSPYWTTSPEQIYTSNTYHPSTNVATLLATVFVQKPTVPIFQCKTVFEITGSTNGYNATAPADSFTVGNTPELDVQSVSDTTTSTTTAPITTAKTNSSKVAESNTNDVAIAMGVLFGISLAVNIAILIIWLCMKLLAKHDPLTSKENVLPPEMMDLSNGTSATSNYEELSRPGEIRLQQSTYEKLTPSTTS